MTDINKTVLVGRLTRDIEITYTNSSAAIGNLSIAVNRSRKQNDQWIDEASFFDVKIYGKMAESLRPYLTKGKQIAVEGFLKQERWQKDGQNFSRVTVGAENVQLLGGNSGNDSHSPNRSNQPQQQRQAAPQMKGGPDTQEERDIINKLLGKKFSDGTLMFSKEECAKVGTWRQSRTARQVIDYLSELYSERSAHKEPAEEFPEDIPF